jgi:hypothetical protein
MASSEALLTASAPSRPAALAWPKRPIVISAARMIVFFMNIKFAASELVPPED